MKRTGTPPTNEETFSRIIGIDIGYGDVKGANSRNTMLMPSVIGAAPTVRYSDEWSRDDGDEVHDNQGVWYIGERALMHSKNVRYIKDRGRTLMNDYRRLVYVAFGRLHPHRNPDEIVTINVATGLPVAHMADSDNLKAMLSGEHRVKTKFADGVYHVDQVAVMPQPYGSLFYRTLDDFGVLVDDSLSKSRVLVVDIGRFTTNVITVDTMAYLERASDSIDSGVHVIEAHIRKHLASEYNWSDPRPDFVQDIILRDDHTVEIDGEPINMTDIVREGTADLAELVNGLIAELIGQGRDVSHMIITGGGGIILEDWIRERYKRAELIDNPVMANAIGFARYGRRKWLK